MLQTTLSSLKKTSKERKKLVKSLNEDLSRLDHRSTQNPAVISEYMKDITYIKQLADSLNPAELNEALMALGFPIIDSRNPAVIDEQRRLLYSYLISKTISGNPITLNILGNLNPEVTGLKVTMNPIQSGTGDPSPTNIRPITGRTEVSVTRTAGEDAETKTHQYSDTIYGGVDDFVNGEGKNEWGLIDLGTLNWQYHTQSGNFYADGGIVNRKEQSNAICSQYVKNNVEVTGVSNLTTNNRFAFQASVSTRVIIRDTTYTDAETFKTAMDGVQLCYELATPTTISTSAEEITLLKGENVISTDGDSIEFTYKQNFT